MPCPDCAGEFLPNFGLVRVERSVVDIGGVPLQLTLAHEMGHYVDATYLTDKDRRDFMRLRGIPAGTDWRSPGLPWRERPVEDFAEVFATLTVPVGRIAADDRVRTRPRRGRPSRRSWGTPASGSTGPYPSPTSARAIAVELDLLRMSLADPEMFWLTAAVFFFAGLAGALVAAWSEWIRSEE